MRIIRITRKRKKEEKHVICPQCETKIICEGKPGQKIMVKCPNCGEEGAVVFTEKKKINFEKSKTKLQIPEKITLRKIIWMLFLFFITVTILFLFFVAATGDINIEILFVSIFIGIVVLKELTDEFTPYHLKKKINILISGLFVIFLLIVVNEIIYLISS